MATAFVGCNTNFQWLVWKLQNNMMHLEPYRHNQLMSVDVAIHELKWRCHNKMQNHNVPSMVLWSQSPSQINKFYPAGMKQEIGIWNCNWPNTLHLGILTIKYAKQGIWCIRKLRKKWSQIYLCIIYCLLAWLCRDNTTSACAMQMCGVWIGRLYVD